VSDCLVLDSNWQPVGFTTWQNAVKLSHEGVAQVVRVDESGKVLHSPGRTWGYPRVIVVRSSWKRRRKLAVSCSRRNLLARDGSACQYCGRRVPLSESEEPDAKRRGYTLDHVVPVCQGGKAAWDNLVVACVPCNKEKGGRTPEQAGMRLLRKPKAPMPNDPRLNRRLNVRKMRPEWQDWRKFISVS